MFSSDLMKKLKQDEILPAVRVLLQHMCTKVADKAEYRSKVAKVTECDTVGDFSIGNWSQHFVFT